MTRSKKLNLSPLIIQPRTSKICRHDDPDLPGILKNLSNFEETQHFEGNECQTECYLVKFYSTNAKWNYFVLFLNCETKACFQVKNKKFEFWHFSMSVQIGDDLPDQGLCDLVYDQNNQERRSWRFCNEITLPRSEVLFFAQMFLIVFIVVISCTKLLFFTSSCEEGTLWFSLLSCAAGYALPNPKLWIK